MIDLDKLEELAKAATTGVPGDRIRFSLGVWDPAAILELIAEVRVLRSTEEAAAQYVQGLLAGDVEMAGEATKKLTNLVLAAVSKFKEQS